MILQLTELKNGTTILVAVSSIKFMKPVEGGTLIFCDGFVREVSEPLGAITSVVGAVKPFQAPLA